MKFFYLPLAQAAPQGAPGPLTHMIPFILMFVIFYFLLIRPQQQKQKEQERMVKNLAKNDEVITSGGLHGTVVGLKESSILLRIAENVKVEVERSAVTQVVRQSNKQQETSDSGG